MKLKNTYVLSITALLIIIFAFIFTSCTAKVTQEDAAADEETQSGDALPGGEEEYPEDTEEIPEEPSKPEFVGKLTGLETTEELSNIRPVAIMINNIKVATPQQGISQADVIYEVLAEGGITRLLCLFTDYATLPETGSIRSSRDYYIDLSDAHDAIYVHCGGSPAAYETLSARKTENMDGISFNTPFYRNEWRKKNMGMEHSMMTTGDLLVKGIQQKGYRTTSDADQPLEFAEKDAAIGGEDASRMTLKYSYYATSVFKYDDEKKVYMKEQYGAPHIDSNNNEQLSFKNVLVLFCSHSGVLDSSGRIAVYFTGEGEGYYMSDGEYKKIKWTKQSRTSPYTLYEEDGSTELVLNPGKSYIGIAPTGSDVNFEA